MEKTIVRNAKNLICGIITIHAILNVHQAHFNYQIKIVKNVLFRVVNYVIHNKVSVNSVSKDIKSRSKITKIFATKNAWRENIKKMINASLVKSAIASFVHSKGFFAIYAKKIQRNTKMNVS